MVVAAALVVVADAAVAILVVAEAVLHDFYPYQWVLVPHCSFHCFGARHQGHQGYLGVEELRLHLLLFLLTVLVLVLWLLTS